MIGHKSNKIYNCDETGLTVVLHKTNKVVYVKNKRQVSSISSAERGYLITKMICMSAAVHQSQHEDGVA